MARELSLVHPAGPLGEGKMPGMCWSAKYSPFWVVRLCERVGDSEKGREREEGDTTARFGQQLVPWGKCRMFENKESGGCREET